MARYTFTPPTCSMKTKKRPAQKSGASVTIKASTQ